MLNSIGNVLLYTHPTIDNALDEYTATGSVAIHLQLGDRVQVGGCGHTNSIWNHQVTHFTGMLVRPDV